MRIGFDLDNTIICYDQAIERLAKETLSIPETVPKTKKSLRDYLRAEEREDEWTKFQGQLYGPGMTYAEPFPDAIDTIAAIQDTGHTTFIISHRTRNPYLGPKYDLHASAQNWIDSRLNVEGQPLFKKQSIHLNETRDEKISLVQSLECEVFIDDLIEVLTDSAFPSTTQKLLFSPNSASGQDSLSDDIKVVRHWTELAWLSRQ